MCKISSPIILPVPFPRYLTDYRELRRLSRRFWHRHRPTWCFVRDYDPGLWADAWETLEEAHNLRWTTEGAVVREFPEMRDASAQAQTRRVHNWCTQTSPTPGREIGVQAEDRAREASPERARVRKLRPAAEGAVLLWLWGAGRNGAHLPPLRPRIRAHAAIHGAQGTPRSTATGVGYRFFFLFHNNIRAVLK